MAVMISIFIALLSGVTVMFTTKYFWGMESNTNVASINASMTAVNSVYNVNVLVLVVVAVMVVVMAVCTVRGF